MGTLVGESPREPARFVGVRAAPPGPVEFAKARLGFYPDAGQCAVLESRAKRGILNCSRQWGKSAVTVVKALHRVMAEPGALVLVSSPSRRQSAEWMRTARGMVARLGISPRGDGDNAVSLLLPNGSRIVGLPRMEDTIRGFSKVALLLIDEAARVSDEMYTALLPMLAVGDGDLWMMSTPRGRSGFFYETWMYGGPEWLKVRGPVTECGRISKEFVEKQRREMGAERFRQEHLCEFVGRGVEVFDRELIEGLLDPGIPALRV